MATIGAGATILMAAATSVNAAMTAGLRSLSPAIFSVAEVLGCLLAPASQLLAIGAPTAGQLVFLRASRPAAGSRGGRPSSVVRSAPDVPVVGLVTGARLVGSIRVPRTSQHVPTMSIRAHATGNVLLADVRAFLRVVTPAATPEAVLLAVSIPLFL